MATTVQTIPDIYHIFSKKSDNQYQKYIAFSNSDRIKNWIRERLTNPQGIAKNPLSQNIEIKCKDHSRVNSVMSMCSSSAIIVLNINASYLLKMVVSVTSIASIFLYNKLAKAVESSKANCFETTGVKACLPYLTDTNAVEKDLKYHEKSLKNELSLDELDEEESYLFREDLKKLSFFTSNSESIKKCMGFFLKNDQMDFNKIRAARDFVFNAFYSVNLLLLLKEIFAIKVTSNMRKINMINTAFGVIIVGSIALSILSIIGSVKSALKLVGHKNDEVKKQELLATITKNERKQLITGLKYLF